MMNVFYVIVCFMLFLCTDRAKTAGRDRLNKEKLFVDNKECKECLPLMHAPAARRRDIQWQILEGVGGVDRLGEEP